MRGIYLFGYCSQKGLILTLLRIFLFAVQQSRKKSTFSKVLLRVYIIQVKKNMEETSMT